MDGMDKNGLLNGQWTMDRDRDRNGHDGRNGQWTMDRDRNGQVQQVTFFYACPFVH
jgi:hypothetical protein